jgi:hypothetical protein
MNRYSLQETKMSEVNKHGLSRDIPDPVAREIRQRCGFGCVNCGSAIYQYEHVDPEFADATSHDPNRIVLLCGTCHDLVTKRFLSKETIKEKAKTPKCKERGFSFGPFDIGNDPPEIALGLVLARNARTLIRICGDDVFTIRAPEQPGGPFLLDARFFDADNKPILDIVANQWRSSSDNWDVEIKGPRITIRKALGNFALILRAEPPARLVIERMDMTHKGIRISCQEGKAFQVIAPDGSTFSTEICCESDDWLVGFDVTETSVAVGRGGTMKVRGPSMAAAPPTQPSRNAPCFCGSGLRFKHCHGRIT